MTSELRKQLVAGLERALAPRVLWLGLFAIFLLISAASWLLRPVPTRAAVLFFPHAESMRLEGEKRPVLPGNEGLEGASRAVAEELLLGPADSRHIEALPRGTRVAETLYRKGRLYVDISEDAVFARNPPLDVGLEALRRTLRYNFPTLGTIVITVGGMQPGVRGLEAPGNPKKSKNN